MVAHLARYGIYAPLMETRVSNLEPHAATLYRRSDEAVEGRKVQTVVELTGKRPMMRGALNYSLGERFIN